jgi:hypothetical protein
MVSTTLTGRHGAHRVILSGMVLCAALAPALHPTVRAAGSPVGAAFGDQGWPMVGHDPQRTRRGTSVGPLHPHRVFTVRGMVGPPLVSPDGSVYFWSAGGLTALDPMGRRR